MSDSVEDLGKNAEEAIKSNLQSGENILLKLLGYKGQALVLTDQRIFVIKWGYDMLFKTEYRTYVYKNINSVDIKSGWLSGTFRINDSSFSKEDDEIFDDISLNAITFPKKKLASFQKAVNKVHSIISAG